MAFTKYNLILRGEIFMSDKENTPNEPRLIETLRTPFIFALGFITILAGFIMFVTAIFSAFPVLTLLGSTVGATYCFWRIFEKWDIK